MTNMTKSKPNSKRPLNPKQQRDLQKTGLLAAADEDWQHPLGTFRLEALSPGSKRRQRSDGLTANEARRLGLTNN